MGRVGTFFKHTFGLRTIAPIVGTITSGLVAFGQTPINTYNTTVWSLALLSIGAGLLLWTANSYDSWRKDKDAKLLKADIYGLLEAVKEGRTAEPFPSSLRNLKEVSNSELKSQADRLAAQLFDFAHREKVARDDLLHDSRPLPDDQQGALRAWDERLRRTSDLHRETETAFRRTFRAEGLALLEEMTKRGASSYTGHSLAWDQGMLVGVDPIGQAAVLVQRTAKSLPD
jgi:hypothetical protein